MIQVSGPAVGFRSGGCGGRQSATLEASQCRISCTRYAPQRRRQTGSQLLIGACAVDGNELSRGKAAGNDFITRRVCSRSPLSFPLTFIARPPVPLALSLSSGNATTPAKAAEKRAARNRGTLTYIITGPDLDYRSCKLRRDFCRGARGEIAFIVPGDKAAGFSSSLINCCRFQ